MDGNGHPIPERGGMGSARQPWPRRAERGMPPGAGRQPAGGRIGRRTPVMDGPARPTPPGRSPGGRPPASPFGRGVPAPPTTGPTDVVDPIEVESPTTVAPPRGGTSGAALPPMPAPQRPVEPRRSVTRKPKRTEPRPAAGRPRPASSRPGRPARDDDEDDRRSLGTALLATAAATVAPGSGHLILGRKRTGALLLGGFLLIIVALVLIVLNVGREALLQNLLSTRTLYGLAIGLLVVALAWVAVIVRTYLLARPNGLAMGQQSIGFLVVAALCLVVAAPLGFGANLANTQVNFINDLFPSESGGTSAAEAIAKPRLNVLLVGSDAGPDRTGARTDTMMVASLDTRTARTVLFGLPRNIEYAQFPPDSPMGEKFPDGFHDRANPDSGNFLLNAVYAYGLENPALAPAGPTKDPGLNMLNQTIGYMLGLDLDYYVEVNMAGFASIIDALGGITVDVGAVPLPIGGITPSGRRVEPDYYIPAGVQTLNGTDALAFARSRTSGTDYERMGRQRCLLQNLLTQKGAADLLTNFQSVAKATTETVATNVPQEVLPQLVALAGNNALDLQSVAFDPSLPDPEEPDGKFNTGKPNFPYMRQVVQNAINGSADPAAGPAPDAGRPVPKAPAPDASSGRDTAEQEAVAGGANAEDVTQEALPSSAPTSLASACGG